MGYSGSMFSHIFVIYECTCFPFVHPLAKSRGLSDLKHAPFPQGTWDNIFCLVTKLKFIIDTVVKWKDEKKTSSKFNIC